MIPNSWSRAQIFAMISVGAGLLLLGLMALWLLPEFQAGAEVQIVVPVPVNFAAPRLELNTLEGVAVSLQELEGQVVLVNNWATWCPPCKAEMPALEAYYETHRDQGFTLIAIEAGEPAAEVAAFVKDYGLTFPIWLDPESLALDQFKNQELPNSYAIDRTGTVRFTWVGVINRKMLEKYVTPLLEEK